MHCFCRDILHSIPLTVEIPNHLILLGPIIWLSKTKSLLLIYAKSISHKIKTLQKMRANIFFLNFPFVINKDPDAYHEGIDHWSQYGLQQKQHSANRALVRDDAVTVANSGLCLNGEEEGRDEAIDIVDARRPRLIL